MKNLLEGKKFKKVLAEIVKNTGLSRKTASNDAERYLEELQTAHKPMANTATLQAFDYLLSRGYADTIDVNPKELKSLSKIMRKHPVAFVMTHKTYIDMIVLALVLGRHGLPLPYTFAGINMAFPGVAQMGKSNGVIFIRRSFRDNHVYKATLRKYIASLVKGGNHFMWAIEGTRSRTGKLVWPKMGILKYIAEAEQTSKREVKYIPVSTVYDLIPDVKEMTLEGRGKNKKPESLLWFIKYLKSLEGNLGKISLRFGAPVKVGQDLNAELPDEIDADPTANYQLPKLAFELIYNINQITPVTTTSLICIVLLSKYSQTKLEIESDVVELMQLIESHKPDVLVDRGRAIGETAQQALNLLCKADLVKQLGEGQKSKYSIVAENYLQATYYSNMAVQHLYCRSFIELALLKVAGKSSKKRTEAFWKEIMTLRNFFKFEFFYSNKGQFSDEVELDFDYMDKDWRKKLKGGKQEVLDILRNQKLLIAQVVLFTYLEAYRVVAYALKSLEPKNEYDDNEILMTAIFLGEEMHWQGRIHRMESVSKPFLLNGIRLARNLNLVPTKKDRKEDEIEKFAAHLEDLYDRIKDLQKFILTKQKKNKSVVPVERRVVPGSKTETVTKEVINGESGSHIAAFFDLDRSLIKGFSAKEFFQTRLLSGKMKPKEIAAQFGGFMVYATGNKNFAAMAAISANGVKGVKEKVFIEVGEEVYMKYLSKEIFPESRALVDAHLAKGHKVAIVSAATPYQVNPIARDLGIEDILCTKMEVQKGKFTGKVIEPACWGEGKAIQARAFAEEHDIDMNKSYFYTDSAEDLPLLEIVGHPQPLNPDDKLSSIAYQNDWPIYRFNDKKRPGISNIIRTMLTAGTMGPAALAGIVSGISNLSMNKGVNSMIGTIGDLGTMVSGIKIVVKGEKHLKKRPAVFLFNHQSNADMFIMAKLLKKDVLAIAKKELEKSPVGPLFKAAGVIFIDRSNKEKAIAAMQPAVDALHRGKSIAIAPEGTRSFDYKLGDFKKGAFHLALQARVPIIPIVIQNAHDVMPRGSAMINPSLVKIRVLPPISTKKWQVSKLNTYIADIRAMYLKELGQQELKLVHSNGKKSVK